jgi:hypothetical protein
VRTSDSSHSGGTEAVRIRTTVEQRQKELDSRLSGVLLGGPGWLHYNSRRCAVDSRNETWPAWCFCGKRLAAALGPGESVHLAAKGQLSLGEE